MTEARPAPNLTGAGCNCLPNDSTAALQRGARPGGDNLRLVAIEYIVFDVGQENPSFAGHLFVVAGTPLPEPHYSLQVWLYEPKPNGICHSTRTSLAPNDREQSTSIVWRERRPVQAPADNFAQRGHVVAEYLADTLLIDDHKGIEIQFDSLDNDLDEITFLEAQENHLLLFVGEEILSVWGAALISAGRYRLFAIRARYDRKRQTHAVDTEAWLILRDDLALRVQGMTPAEIIYKLQPFLLQDEYDLALVTPVSMTLRQRAYRPLAPLNVRVAGDGYNPTYGTGADIVADWDQSASRSSADPVTKVLSPDIDKTALEVLTTGDVLVGTFEFSGASGPRTITNAQLVARALSTLVHALRTAMVDSGLIKGRA